MVFQLLKRGGQSKNEGGISLLLSDVHVFGFMAIGASTIIRSFLLLLHSPIILNLSETPNGKYSFSFKFQFLFLLSSCEVETHWKIVFLRFSIFILSECFSPVVLIIPFYLNNGCLYNAVLKRLL